jgi:hypothetical protein
VVVVLAAVHLVVAAIALPLAATMPWHARALVSWPPRPMRVTRLDATTLLVSALRDPFVSPFDLLFRGRPFVEGEMVGLPSIEVTVPGVTAGRLREACFRFDAPLEDPRCVWVRWRGGRYVPFVPPPPGTAVVVDRGSEPEGRP